MKLKQNRDDLVRESPFGIKINDLFNRLLNIDCKIYLRTIWKRAFGKPVIIYLR